MENKIELMGIVNITDNSYVASSRCLGADGKPDINKILTRVRQMISEGADILDIGACSTGAGTEGVGEKEEWKRIYPTLKAIRAEFPNIKISIDTYWASVVQNTYELIGDFIINDISAGAADPLMLSTAGRLKLPYIAMHMRGTPKNMQTLTDYPEGIVKAVYNYFTEFSHKAEENNINNWILDPGFGFAKTIEQNYELLNGIDKFKDFNRPILIGVSRKSMIYRLFNITPEDALPATQILHYIALSKGTSILRVHDIAETVRTLKIFSKLETYKKEK